MLAPAPPAHLEGEQLHVWCKAGACCVLTANDSSHKAAMAQTICQAVLVRPVGALLDVAYVGVTLTDTSVKNTDLRNNTVQDKEDVGLTSKYDCDGSRQPEVARSCACLHGLLAHARPAALLVQPA